jgi:hypothetical protein
LHFWITLAGTGELVVRFFSVCFGIALIPLAYCLGVSIKDRHVGWWSAFLAALAPFFVDEAQQTRMYTLLVFISALSIYFLLRAVHSSHRSFWVAYALTAMLSLYAHYSFIYVLAAQNLFLLVGVVKQFRRTAGWHGLMQSWWVSQFAIVALYLFQVPNILRQMGIYGNPGMIPPSLWQYLTEMTGAFLLGTKVDAGRITWLTLVLVIVLVSALTVAWRNRSIDFLNRGVLLVVFWFVVPFAACYIVLQKSPQFTPRYAMVATVPLYMMIGFALASISRRSLTMSIALIALITSAYAGAWQSIYASPAFQNDDTRGVAHFISEHATKDDVVFIDVPFPFFYYYRGDAPAQYLFVDPQTVADKLTQASQNKKQLFFIRWFKSDTDPQGFVPFLLEKYSRQVGDASFRGYDAMWYQLPRDVVFSFAPMSRPVSIIFGDKIKLTGFAFGGVRTAQTPDVDAPLVALGSKAWVALWWELVEPVNENYKVSIQIRDAAGQLAAQDDRMLIDDHHLNTRWWAVDKPAMNVYMPELGDDAKPGEYAVYVIVYDPQNIQPLPVDARSAFPIGTLRIIP